MGVKLGDANSARLPFCVLRPLRRIMLNLAKLCKQAQLETQTVSESLLCRDFFERLLCIVVMLARLLCSACFVYTSIGRL
jgi:hypothetical protein